MHCAIVCIEDYWNLHLPLCCALHDLGSRPQYDDSFDKYHVPKILGYLILLLCSQNHHLLL